MLEQEIAEIIKQIDESLDCPNCPNQGWYIISRSGHGCNGTDEDCSRTCPVEIPEQEQCEWCYTQENSHFNVINNIPQQILDLVNKRLEGKRGEIRHIFVVHAVNVLENKMFKEPLKKPDHFVDRIITLLNVKPATVSA